MQPNSHDKRLMFRGEQPKHDIVIHTVERYDRTKDILQTQQQNININNNNINKYNNNAANLDSIEAVAAGLAPPPHPPLPPQRAASPPPPTPPPARCRSAREADHGGRNTPRLLHLYESGSVPLKQPASVPSLTRLLPLPPLLLLVVLALLTWPLPLQLQLLLMPAQLASEMEVCKDQRTVSPGAARSPRGSCPDLDRDLAAAADGDGEDDDGGDHLVSCRSWCWRRCGKVPNLLWGFVFMLRVMIRDRVRVARVGEGLRRGMWRVGTSNKACVRNTAPLRGSDRWRVNGNEKSMTSRCAGGLHRHTHHNREAATAAACDRWVSST